MFSSRGYLENFMVENKDKHYIPVPYFPTLAILASTIYASLDFHYALLARTD
jgi:hypothetical protein